MLFDIEYHLPTLPNISSTEEYLYKPSQWEDEVVFSNYLGNLTPNEIFERITTIKKNKAVFSSTYSDLITLDNKYACFGKWFWEKKLFQSKLAYALKTKTVLDYEELKFPICENPFNRNSLFKYGNSTHMKKLFQEGEIYIPLAYNYKNDANEHRQDNELEKSSEYDFSHKSIIDKNLEKVLFQDSCL